MKRLFKGLLIFLGILLIIGVSTITTIDLSPVQEKPHFNKMMNRLDSLEKIGGLKSAFQVGFAKVSLTPDSIMDLAGYGNRNPKAFDQVLDSIYVRTIVVKNADKKAAIVSAELLIIHPKMRDHLYSLATKYGWKKEELYLSATHTHSSIGQWAPGLVGGLFAGSYDEEVAQRIAEKIMESINEASTKLTAGTFGFTQKESGSLVYNRLVQKKGIIDPFLKNVSFSTADGKIAYSTFSAHATCFSHHSRSLTGDYPSYFHKKAIEDSTIIFSSYAAGAVASMGPYAPEREQKQAKYLGEKLASRIDLSGTYDSLLAISQLKIPLELGKSQFKLNEDFVLRPYLFEIAFGKEPSEISVLKLNNTLLIGTPCDFSGELAVPLYEYAQKKGMNLVITSFNGGYIGYITLDKWYNIGKYETLTMNWFGPGNGEYFSTIIKKIIDAVG